MRGQDFDRDGPFDADIARFVNLAHSARADGGKDFVRAEAAASSETHFFSAAVQLSTTVISEDAASSRGTLSRKRWPSRVTSYCALKPAMVLGPFNIRASNNGTAVPASTAVS